MKMRTRAELEKTPKSDLARIHKYNGGLLKLTEYMKWRKDELVQAVLEDQARGVARQ